MPSYTSSDESDCEIEKVVNKRTWKGKTQYKVKFVDKD